MGFLDWFLGSPGPREDKTVDHALDPQPTYRTKGQQRFLSDPLIPMITRCMEHYRYGPPEGQVYAMMSMVLEEAASGDTVLLSFEEMHFIQQAGVSPEELFSWRI